MLNRMNVKTVFALSKPFLDYLLVSLEVFCD